MLYIQYKTYFISASSQSNISIFLVKKLKLSKVIKINELNENVFTFILVKVLIIFCVFVIFILLFFTLLKNDKKHTTKLGE